LDVINEKTDRLPEDILAVPVLVDYVNGLNFILYEEKSRIESQSLEAQLQEKKRMEQEEIERLASQKRTDEINARMKLATERAAMEIARKERIRLLRLEKSGKLPLELPKHRKVKFSEMQTLGVGKTHQSCCHESREVIDIVYSKFFFQNDTYFIGSFHHRHELQQIGYANSSLAEYLRTMNKSMPIEKIKLDPFDSPPQPRKTTKPKSRKELQKRREPKPLQKAFVDNRTELDYIQSALGGGMPGHESDLDYIRNSCCLPPVAECQNHLPLFQASRKFFIPSLTFVSK
jgi:hypothetical protein